ncbi:MAG: hypothetical protein EB013_06970 [Actinobacteria bacterium]|nr:hypothetical protein [Actinomycetota bacterium]NDE40273.1 hypothetical protein [Actinomycetota bacterium]NDF90304.1 hypothetical protein [Actinomycetota bacterium]
MSYKSDVKPVSTSATSAVLYTGPTRLRGFLIQSTGSSGSAIINGLANATTVSSSTNTQVFLQVFVGAGQTETLNLPEDGILYAGRNGTGIIDGVGVTSNSGALNITLFIDK